MLNIERALKNNQILRSLTGLDTKQFAKLAISFAEELLRHQKSARRKRKPQRAAGGGRPHTLESAEYKLFFILMYLRVYPTMEVSGFLFDVVRSVICDWVHELLPVLQKTLGRSFDLPKRKIRSVEEFLEKFPEIKRLIIDGTERPRTRPKDSEKQKSHYSGKKKRHAMKNTLVVDPKRKRILVLGKTVPGTVVDKKDLDSMHLVQKIPEEIPILVDLGYKGLEHEYVGIRIPIKKPRNGSLTDQQKESNRELSRQRVPVEHRIGHAKRYRCISDIYRNRRAKTEDTMMLVCCALSNYFQRTKSRARA